VDVGPGDVRAGLQLEAEAVAVAQDLSGQVGEGGAQPVAQQVRRARERFARRGHQEQGHGDDRA